MRHSTRLFAMIAIIATVFAFTSAHPASAASCAIIDITAQDSASGLATLVVGHSYTITIFANGVPVSGPETFVADSEGPFSAGISNPGFTVRILLVDNSADCSPAETHFDPGDGRLNTKPGDRLAVYCNADQTPSNLDVWVIDNNSKGHELIKLPLADLTAVPTGQFFKDLGANGTIFAGLDANGDGYVALKGGEYHGTGLDDWQVPARCKG